MATALFASEHLATDRKCREEAYSESDLDAGAQAGDHHHCQVTFAEGSTAPPLVEQAEPAPPLKLLQHQRGVRLEAAGPGVLGGGWIEGGRVHDDRADAVAVGQ